MNVGCNYDCLVSLSRHQRQVTVEEIERALTQVNRKFYVDGDFIVKKPKADAEPDYDLNGADLVCGEVTFQELEEGVPKDQEVFYEWAEEREGRAKLLDVFKRAKSMVTVQVFNGGGMSDIYEETIEPLWDWFIANHEGLIIAEGGYFYDKSGLIQ